MKELTADQLKTKLAAGERVTVVDIRDEDGFEAWHIPGAVNLPVIEAMRAGNPEPLVARASEVPADEPVVVVCNMGISSLRAAAVLEPLGFDVASLVGGMRSWSLVHTEARVETPKQATVIQIRRNGKGCLSYLLGSGGAAAVVDPSVDTGVYTEIARREGLEIKKVLETHVHADHVSRARALCAETGATLHMQANDRATFEFAAMKDGDELRVGDLGIKTIATPGHTGESMSYLVDDELLLTGDTLFVDAVGRPDLEKGDAGADAGARMLFRTLHGPLADLDENVLVLPAHTGAEIGFAGVPIAERLGALRGSIDLLQTDEETFVSTILARLGAKPPSYEAIIGVNEGRADLGGTDPVDLEAGPNRCAVR